MVEFKSVNIRFCDRCGNKRSSLIWKLSPVCCECFKELLINEKNGYGVQGKLGGKND